MAVNGKSIVLRDKGILTEEAMFREIPCGCRTCGCVCTEHAAAGVEPACALHRERPELVLAEEVGFQPTIPVLETGALEQAKLFPRELVPTAGIDPA